MIYICSIIALFMAGIMFFVSTDKKVSILFVAAMTLSLLRMEFLPFLKSAVGFITISFIISEIKKIKGYVNIISNNKSLKILFLLLFAMIVKDIVFSPHLHSIKEIFQYFFSYLFLKYFFLFYAFVSVKNINSLKYLIKLSMIGIIVLTMFGIINYIQGKSTFVTEMLSNHSSLSFTEERGGEYYVNSFRFRVQSMFQNPFNYGFYCCICLLLYVYVRDIIDRKLYNVMVICCTYGIVMCGCRTIIVCTIIGLGLYSLLVFKMRRIFMILIISVLIVAISYNFIPIVAEKIDLWTSVLTDTEGASVGGSSIAMRSVQFAVTLSYIQDKPLFGCGVDFFNIDLGWQDNNSIEQDLHGLEGVHLVYLLEHGWIGYICYLLVWGILCYLICKNFQKNKKMASLGIAVWCIYMIFAHMTGELASVMPTLIIVGCIIGEQSLNVYTYRN